MKAKKKLILATITILGVAWLTIVLLLCHITAAGRVGTIGLVFGILDFILVYALNLVPDKGRVPNDASAPVIPFMVSIIFLGTSVVMNTILIILASLIILHFPILSTLAVMINILLIAGFSIYSLYALAYLGGLKSKDEAARKRTAGTTQISAMLGKLLAMANTPEEKKALRKLKETVDFSTNSTTKLSSCTEETIIRQLREIQSAMAGHESSEAVMDRIDQALRTWQARNAMND